MFDNTLSVAFGTNTVNMTRINQQNYSSEYFGSYTGAGDALRDVRMNIKHTLPNVAGGLESHLVRFDIDLYDTESQLLRTCQLWQVLRTVGGVQDSAALGTYHTGMQGLLDSTFVGRVVNRES